MAAAPAPAPTAPAGDQPIIPDAGVYGTETAAAQNAYNNALAQAAAQRNALYSQYGLNQQGAVDVNNPEGQYQQMLGAQGSQFQADQQDAAARGLRGPGLGNQQLSADRNAANASDFQFQNQVAQAGTDYSQAQQNALSQMQNADSTAYQDAINTALQNMLTQMQAGNYTAPGSNDSSPTNPSPKPPAKGKPDIDHPRRRQRRSGGSGGGGGNHYVAG